MDRLGSSLTPPMVPPDLWRTVAPLRRAPRFLRWAKSREDIALSSGEVAACWSCVARTAIEC